MAAKRRRTAISAACASEEEEAVISGVSAELDASSLELHQLDRIRLRRRWELASVLNFFHVFEPVIRSDLRISAEEIETALITANENLGRIHIGLLKGIPPVSKSLAEDNAWVAVVCKKLAPWWPWVAEGEAPFKWNHGEETKKYKELDPTTRLLMLKALCEVRADQDDISRHITGQLKEGTELTAFRKEKIGSDEYGITYWHDGDRYIGHRLYKEVVKFDFKPKLKGKCCSLSKIHSKWETLATNLDEFREIAEKLSSSNMSKAEAVGEIIRVDLLPVLEKIQKKRETALKRKQRHAALLDNFQSTYRIGINRSCRQRNRVCYTFEEFDRSISEAITQMSKKTQTIGEHGAGGKQVELVSSGRNKIMDDSKNQDNDIAEQENSLQKQTEISFIHDEKDDKAKQILGVDGILRNAVNRNEREARTHAETKTRLRQRPIPNSGYRGDAIFDS